jgi:hypothetical protein
VMKPNSPLESAILKALKQTPVLTLQKLHNIIISEGFNVSYHQSRRALLNLIDKGQVFELPRKENNRLEVSLEPSATNLTFKWLDGKRVTSREFIHLLAEKDSSGIFKDEVWLKLRGLIFTALATSYEKPYGDSLPPVAEVRQHLEDFVSAVSLVHSFVKNFMESSAFSPNEREILARLFSGPLSEEHQIMLNETLNE